MVYTVDTDVTVTEFFGSAVNLGTGGFCRVDALEDSERIRLRIQITFGTSMSIGSLPITIMASDMPVTIPDFGDQTPQPGNFGAMSTSGGGNEMYVPTLNNISGHGNCFLFFNAYGASFTDFLLGSAVAHPPVAGSVFFSTIDIYKNMMG
jgi:hypothetical protein